MSAHPIAGALRRFVYGDLQVHDDLKNEQIVRALTGQAHTPAIIDRGSTRWIALRPLPEHGVHDYCWFPCLIETGTDYGELSETDERIFTAELREAGERMEPLGWIGREDGHIVAGPIDTAEVVDWFWSRAQGIDRADPTTVGMDQAGAMPAAYASFAVLPIGGDIDEAEWRHENGQRGCTPDKDWPDNVYHWYFPKDVPVGGIIYRISCTPTLWLFRRLDEQSWEPVCVPNVRWPRGRVSGHAMDAWLDGAYVMQRVVAAQT